MLLIPCPYCGPRAEIEFSENALKAIIANYTREAGLRNLERSIASVCRKVARQVAEGRKAKVRIIASSLEGYLGAAPVTREEALSEDQIGAATGLHERIIEVIERLEIGAPV